MTGAEAIERRRRAGRRGRARRREPRAGGLGDGTALGDVAVLVHDRRAVHARGAPAAGRELDDARAVPHGRGRDGAKARPRRLDRRQRRERIARVPRPLAAQQRDGRLKAAPSARPGCGSHAQPLGSLEVMHDDGAAVRPAEHATLTQRDGVGIVAERRMRNARFRRDRRGDAVHRQRRQGGVMLLRDRQVGVVGLGRRQRRVPVRRRVVRGRCRRLDRRLIASHEARLGRQIGEQTVGKLGVPTGRDVKVAVESARISSKRTHDDHGLLNEPAADGAMTLALGLWSRTSSASKRSRSQSVANGSAARHPSRARHRPPPSTSASTSSSTVRPAAGTTYCVLNSDTDE